MNPPDASTSSSPSSTSSPGATQPPPQRRPSLAILQKAASVKRRSQLDGSNPSQHQRPSTPLQLSSPSQAATVTEEIHTYTLCLLGYLQTFSSSSSGSIKEIPLQLDSAIRHVSCGLDWLCILTERGRVYSFGSNTYGQLAQGHLQSISYPKPICFALEKRIVRVSCGTNHGGFLLDNGALFMFGCGSYGRLGTGNEQSQSTPVAVKMRWSLLQAKAAALSGELVSTIPGGNTGSMRMAVPGSQAAAGQSMGPSDSNVAPSDTASDDEVTFNDISCGDRHTLLLGAKITLLHGKKMAKTHLIACGDGTNGRLGIGSESDHHSGVLLTQFRASIACYVPSFASIHAGAAHNAAVTTAGEVFTWGSGADGQLGHDVHESEWLPREVQFFRGISMAVAKCGAKHTVAISRTGVVYTWGRGLEGQLGSGGITGSVLPQRARLAVDPLALQQAQIDAQLAAGSSSSTFSSSSSIVAVQDTRVLVRSIVARENMTLAMDEQSRVFAWGDNSASQLGLQPGPSSLEPLSELSAVSARLGSSSCSSNRVVTPRQLLYQNLKEPKKLASRVRDRVLAATASTSLPRVALTQIEASDRFSVLVFRTKAPANPFGHGDSESRSSGTLQSSSVGSVAACLARHRSSYMNDVDGSTVTWHFGLTDPLPVTDIPSREAAYYKYMVQYKVHIRVAKGERDADEDYSENDDGGSGSGSGSHRHRKSSQTGMPSAPLRYARRRNSVLTIPLDMREQLKPLHPESDDDSDDVDDWEQRRRAMLQSFPSPRSAAEAVKGFDAWLARRHRNHRHGNDDGKQLSPEAAHSPQKNGHGHKPLYHFGTAPRFPRHSSPSATAIADKKLDEPRQSTGCRAQSATTTAVAARKPCPPKSAFGRRTVTKPSPRGSSASSSSSRRPATATDNQTSPKPPASRLAASVSPSSAAQPPSRDARQRLFNQFVAPFGSSVTCRFGPKSPCANDANQLIIYPEKCDSMAFPRSPRPHLGDSAEQFSVTIARRLQHAKGVTPGPGTYDRHGG